MSESHTELLSAFFDGEAVDPARLASALADPVARDALVDFARLRAAVAPTEALPAALQQPAAQRGGAPWTPRGWRIVAAFAAMVVLIVYSASLLPTLRKTRENGSAPPTPSRVYRYVPGIDWQPEHR
jgi:hypothetical protein